VQQSPEMQLALFKSLFAGRIIDHTKQGQ
jgi:hypothetical protein